MRIKKTSQYIEGGANLSTVYGTSNENGYTQDYINKLQTYSTTEQRVGTWIDGKPLYRKVVSSAMPQVSTDGTVVTLAISLVPSNTSNMFFVEWCFANGTVNNSYYAIPIPTINHSAPSSQFATYNLYGRSMELRSSKTSWNDFTVYISVLYTKIAD